MPARRCSLCGISYPTLPEFSVCPIHQEETQYLSNVEPDSDWKDSLERMARESRVSDELTRAIPLVRGVTVVEDKGLLFVDQTTLHHAGLRLSRMVPNQFHLFELDDGWVYETQGWDEPRRRWWVERVIQSEGVASRLTISAGVPLSTESATG